LTSKLYGVVGDILQPTHLIFVLVIALLVLGPKRLPEVGRSLGKGLRDFRMAMGGEEPDRHDEIVQQAPVESTPAVATTAPVAAQPAPAPVAVSQAESVPEPVAVSQAESVPEPVAVPHVESEPEPARQAETVEHTS
jgi:sec-independent protein translocase protein TatA